MSSADAERGHKKVEDSDSDQDTEEMEKEPCCSKVSFVKRNLLKLLIVLTSLLNFKDQRIISTLKSVKVVSLTVTKQNLVKFS